MLLTLELYKMGEKAKAGGRSYLSGVKKYLALYLLCLVVLEGLALAFPMLLKYVTGLINKSGVVPMDIVLSGLLVLGFIILIFGANFVTEWMGCTYADRYQGNMRRALYEKFNRISPEKIDELGSGRILPMIMNDTNWLKLYNKRIVNFIIFFPVAILGSFIMIFQLNHWYGLFAFASVPIVLLFFWLNVRKLGKIIPQSVEAYDEYFLNIKEGIAGAKDIRILGKAEERSEQFAEYVKLQRKQGLKTDRAINLSTSFNALLFTVITIAIIIYGALFNMQTAQNLVVLNTAIQYVNKIWAGSHLIFTWFVDYIPRCRVTRKRLATVYAIPDEPYEHGAKTLPAPTKEVLKLDKVSFVYPNGFLILDNIDVTVKEGTRIAIAGGIGSGKNVIAQMLLGFVSPAKGTLLFNGTDATSINSNYWRKNVVSYCSESPKFIPGTVRDNMRLLSPQVTDAQILQVFEDIGAQDFVTKFKKDGLLDFVIQEGKLGDNVKNLLNLVRAVLKPARLYVFHQCFAHVKHDYIAGLMKMLKKQKKTCLLISYNGAACKHSDQIYVLENGHISGTGKHDTLLRTNTYYRELHAAQGTYIMKDENVGTSAPHDNMEGGAE